jgi:preprotein translocase subunit SecY
MAVQTEQQAGGLLNLSNLRLAKDLQKRLWFTLGALVVFRLLSFVPLPGIDPRALGTLFDSTRGGVLDFFNMFSGGGLERMSLIALGIMPYITAAIVMQIASSMSPTLAALKKEGHSGRQKLNQYTRYGTVLLCVVQGYFMAVGLEGWGSANGASAVLQPGIMFRLTTVINLVGGSMFLLWLGEQVTSRGVGNGVSLIITAGIIAQLPVSAAQAFEGGRTGSISPVAIVAVLAFAGALILFICFMELAQRQLPIQYPKRQAGRSGMQAERSHLPLKVNAANVIPPIFASSLLLMPLTIVQFAGNGAAGESAWGDFVIAITTSLQHGAPLYMGLYGLGIVYFTFFYTSVVFNPEETADNLKRYGGFIPGIRPGKRTEDYLRYVLNRITVVGAAYLTLICLVPEYFIAQAGIPFFLAGTSLLIVVNVTMDTVSQIRSHLMAHQYGDLIKKAKLKSAPAAPHARSSNDRSQQRPEPAALRRLPLRSGAAGEG